jgi:hypothetical protein
MSQARRLECSCDWCGRVVPSCGFQFKRWKPWGWQTVWRICDDCADRLFELRGRETYGTIEQSRALRLQQGWEF